MSQIFRQWAREESGQAIIEYILLIGAAVSMIIALKTSLNSITGKLWKRLAQRIAVGCPGCSAEDDFTF